ncbi:hypothetical protein DNH61_01600 [Paenibacillus sambharensis]|uniref:Uncharacterized protein n=1 Tax=Paenibacillus sambharensis TaxID=1803190 RepID=A0A2W1LFI3_9BACL|nr:hypothetical protein DNH61_01600 [Paenibacillus sambharensis]
MIRVNRSLAVVSFVSSVVIASIAFISFSLPLLLNLDIRFGTAFAILISIIGVVSIINFAASLAALFKQSDQQNRIYALLSIFINGFILLPFIGLFFVIFYVY